MHRTSLRFPPPLLFAVLALLLAAPPGWGAADEPIFSLLPPPDQRLSGTRISDDGTQVYYSLSPLAGGPLQSFVHDLATGHTTLLPPGTPLPQTVNIFSENGRYSVSAGPGGTQLIRDELTDEETVFIAESAGTIEPVISADGSTGVFQVGAFQHQSLLVGDRETGAALVIDPQLDPVLQEVLRMSISDDGRTIASAWIYGPQFATALLVHRNPGPPPVAECRSLIVDTDPGLCTANVEASAFDAGSSDPRGRPLTFSVSPAGPYQLGTTDVVLTVSNGENSATCPAQITVRDREPPQVDCDTAIPLLLELPGWPLVDIGLMLTSSDNCEVVSVDVTITQDEPVHGPGDPGPDAEVLRSDTGEVEGLRLRAQVDPGGNGRVYLIRATATDASGNQGSGVCTVVVPRQLTFRSVLSVVFQGIIVELFGQPLPYDSESQAMPVQTG